MVTKLHSKFSTSDRTHARTGPETPRAEQHKQTRTTHKPEQQPKLTPTARRATDATPRPQTDRYQTKRTRMQFEGSWRASRRRADDDSSPVSFFLQSVQSPSWSTCGAAVCSLRSSLDSSSYVCVNSVSTASLLLVPASCCLPAAPRRYSPPRLRTLPMGSCMCVFSCMTVLWYVRGCFVAVLSSYKKFSSLPPAACSLFLDATLLRVCVRSSWAFMFMFMFMCVWFV